MSTPTGGVVLYFSLVPSFLILLAGLKAAKPAPYPVRWGSFALWGGACVVVPMCATVMSFVAIFVWIATAAALGVWPLVRRRVRSFLPLSVAAVLVPYLVAVLLALPQMANYRRLRATYPYESMADRVPEPPASSASLAMLLQASEVDHEIDEQQWRSRMREHQLDMLHEHTTKLFVNSPGFGVARMPLTISEEYLAPLRRDGTPDQPASRPSGSNSTDRGGEPRPSLPGLHVRAVVDFVNPNGFGLVKSRERVAGFQPHAFSRVPEPADGWAVDTIELVGLLRHPEPVVYVSAKLPAMTELKGTPTRRLDTFEERGLADLTAGQELVITRDGDQTRMLGSLRNGRTCITCHGGRHRDLLGAFTYTLRASDRPAAR